MLHGIFTVTDVVFFPPKKVHENTNHYSMCFLKYSPMVHPPWVHPPNAERSLYFPGQTLSRYSTQSQYTLRSGVYQVKQEDTQRYSSLGDMTEWIIHVIYIQHSELTHILAFLEYTQIFFYSCKPYFLEMELSLFVQNDLSSEGNKRAICPFSVLPVPHNRVV